MTVICVLVACLFPGAGYYTVLATAFGLPGLRSVPGAEIPSGSAFSQARKLLGEQVMQRLFELDAAVTDADLGIGCGGRAWRSPRSTAPRWSWPGTTCSKTGSAPPRTAPGRCCGSPRTSAPHLPVDQRRDRRLPRRRERPGRPDEDSSVRHPQPRRPRLLLQHRWIRFSAGADLAWRIKNGARSVSLETIRTLPDGSGLVMLHESDGMRTRRRKEAGDPRADRLPDTTARLVTFTVTTATRSGRTKTTRMRVLTTLLDHEAYPAREIAALYAERWQIEIAFLHLKRTVRGSAGPCAAVPPTRPQEAWALLLIESIVATATARAAGPAGLDPGLIPFTAVLGLIRSHVAAETPCRHCGHRPASPLASLNTAILALPRHRQDRQRTSGRTAAERRTRHTEEVTYTIDITKSNSRNGCKAES